MKKELYLGLDVHKDCIITAEAEEGRKGEVRQSGAFSNDLHAVEKWIGRLRKAHGKEVILRACYEAGPCGFGLARRLKQLGVECEVVAPSLTPMRSADRVKTDRRDARKLARLLRAGELTPVYIPDARDEAIRDLCRARSDAVDDRRRSRIRTESLTTALTAVADPSVFTLEKTAPLSSSTCRTCQSPNFHQSIATIARSSAALSAPFDGCRPVS